MYVFGGNHNGRYFGDIQEEFFSAFKEEMEIKRQLEQVQVA